MNLWINFWKITISVEDIMVQVGIMMILMLISNIIRRKIKVVRRSLIPTAAIGGILILLLKQIPGVAALFNNDFMELVTYHSLAIGCIAIALKSTTIKNTKEKKNKVMDAGLITVNTYLLQGIIGAAITAGLYLTFMNDNVRLFVSGMLLPLGFGQGSGQALNFGQIYETQWGLEGGASFGLTIAAIGFLAACFVGVYHLNKLKKKGIIKTFDNEAVFSYTEETSSPNDVALSESVDRFTIQMALIILVYFLVYVLFLIVSKMPNDGFVGNTLKPLIFGFNFLFGTIFAALVRVVCKQLTNKGLMTHVYPNNYLLNRISGFAFDVMIIAGIGAIEISVVGPLIVPLTLICGVGLFVTYKYVYYVCKKTFPAYPEEAFLSMFGMLTGTNSTGIILLREIDPQFETPAATNLILQSIYAIAFGFPLLLLLGIAPQSVTMTFVSIGIFIAMFVVYNLVLFRTSLGLKFKKGKVKS